MVSFNVYRATSSGAYVEGVCLATDEKPITGIANGSILYAVDPTDGSTTRYMFDQSTATWIEAECPCSGGGSSGGGGEGGGSGSGGANIVNMSADIPSRKLVLDKTFSEIKDMILNNGCAFVRMIEEEEGKPGETITVVDQIVLTSVNVKEPYTVSGIAYNYNRHLGQEAVEAQTFTATGPDAFPSKDITMAPG